MNEGATAALGGGHLDRATQVCGPVRVGMIGGAHRTGQHDGPFIAVDEF